MIQEHIKEEGFLPKIAIGYFLLILIGSLLAAVLGGLFAMVISMISPEFIRSLFSLAHDDGSVTRYASTVGMIWGLFIGAAVAGFSCFLSVVLKIIRLRIEHRSHSKTEE
jgi:ABC-type multidrug transport system fused ATPase/permease subunit